jgi:hypothetical protein
VWFILSSLVYIPIEGERKIAETNEYLVSNYRLVQWDRGSRSSVSIPLHIIKEYKLTSRSAMIKVINGVINLIGKMPRREELRAALGLREFDSLKVGDQRKLCEVSGIPYVHSDHPYNRWVTVGYHRKFSRHFYTEFAWIKGEEVFTYFPSAFNLTNYRLYQYDEKRKKLYIFPLNMVHTFESRKDQLKIQATTGKFEIKGKVPRQDHMVRVWQARAWDIVPSEHLDWLVRSFSYIQPRHPLSQYAISDTATVAPTPVAQETQRDMEVTSGMAASAGTVFVKPVIKDRCDNCGASLSWENIDWVGPDQYACPNCGKSHKMGYDRF